MNPIDTCISVIQSYAQGSTKDRIIFLTKLIEVLTAELEITKRYEGSK